MNSIAAKKITLYKKPRSISEVVNKSIINKNTNICVKFNPEKSELKHMYDFYNLKMSNFGKNGKKYFPKLNFQSFYGFRNLRNVHLEKIQIKNRILKTLFRSRSQDTIESLTIKDCSHFLTTDGFEEIGRLKNLKHFTLKKLYITDELFLYLTDTKLESLTLSRCRNLTDLCLNLILPDNLVKLKLSTCFRLKGTIINKFTNLTELKISRCYQICSVDIKNLTKLRKIKLKEINFIDKKIYFPLQLKNLNLLGSNNVSRLLRYNDLSNLETLLIDDGDVIDNEIVLLPNIKNLHIQNMYKLTNASINNLRNLKKITLKNCNSVRVDRLDSKIIVEKNDPNILIVYLERLLILVLGILTSLEYAY